MLKYFYMSIVTCEDISHLAELSSLSFSDAEAKSIAKDLEAIIIYASQLSQLDTTGVEPTTHIYEMQNVWRPDTITPQDASRDQMLALAPQSQEHQIKVPKVL